jgi:hypothetical protein
MPFALRLRPGGGGRLRARCGALLALLCVLGCAACGAGVNYVKLTSAEVVGAWKFPDGSWVVLEPGGTAYIDPILYAGNDNIPLTGGLDVKKVALAGTWALVADGQVNYVQYTIPGTAIPARLRAESPTSPLADQPLYGCMQGSQVVLFGQIDPDSSCDSTGMMQRVSGSF